MDSIDDFVFFRRVALCCRSNWRRAGAFIWIFFLWRYWCHLGDRSSATISTADHRRCWERHRIDWSSFCRSEDGWLCVVDTDLVVGCCYSNGCADVVGNARLLLTKEPVRRDLAFSLEMNKTNPVSEIYSLLYDLKFSSAWRKIAYVKAKPFPCSSECVLWSHIGGVKLSLQAFVSLVIHGGVGSALCPVHFATPARERDPDTHSKGGGLLPPPSWRRCFGDENKSLAPAGNCITIPQ